MSNNDSNILLQNFENLLTQLKGLRNLIYDVEIKIDHSIKLKYINGIYNNIVDYSY